MKLLNSSLIAVAATVALSTSAFAWHVGAGSYDQAVIEPTATTTQRGPSGDPRHRVIVKVSKLSFGACEGYIEDKGWAGVITASPVRGAAVVARIRGGDGVRHDLKAGTYYYWAANGERADTVNVSCNHGIATAQSRSIAINFGYFGREGRTIKRINIPAGCTYKSGWVYMQPRTKFWVQDTTNQTRVKTWTSGKAGNYGKLYKGFERGVSC